MAVKAVNDTAGPNSIVLILLVFGAYLYITEESPLLPSIIKRAKVLYKATNEVRRLHARRQVQNALIIRNGPSTKSVLQLPL